ncbi:magnesium transporter, partial [Mycena polygramma]
QILGIILAVASGFLIGASFVFKKKGLLRSQAAGTPGEGVKYLKSPLWWAGMSMMILGELCNFAAYAFVEAIVVTPMGALSVVVCAILSAIFLKERLTLLGWLGCGLCILGATVIALNAPEEATVGQILDFQKLFVSVIFLVYFGVILVASLVIIFVIAPRYGKTNMLWYILVCSMIGGISVSVTTGLGAAIVTTVGGDNQFKHWFIYVLIVVVLATLVVEVYYLNVALALFNTVTPTYYVIFTFFSIVTTLVLFRGLSASIPSILTLVLGFLVICIGIVILQLSKREAEQKHAREEEEERERRSTLLAWSPTEFDLQSEEKVCGTICSFK